MLQTYPLLLPIFPGVWRLALGRTEQGQNLRQDFQLYVSVFKKNFFYFDISCKKRAESSPCTHMLLLAVMTSYTTEVIYQNQATENSTIQLTRL